MRSGVPLAFATVITVASVVSFQGDLVSLLFVLMALSFLSGFVVAPIVWWSIHRRPDLVLAPIDVEADTDGLTRISSQATRRDTWSAYRRVRETSRGFLLDSGVGPVEQITKRGVGREDIEAFRALLGAVGLLKPATMLDRLRPLLWVALGLAVAVALGFATGTLQIVEVIAAIGGALLAMAV
jgi:hypothetical protein